MMRVVCISDTHSLHLEMSRKVPKGDVLIHAGDMTNTGLLQEIVDFNEWMRKLPHKHKLVIAGNHDFGFEEDPDTCEAYLTDCTYLMDKAVKIEGVTFYGTPWQPWFYDWAFNLPRGEKLAQIWAKIPKNTDVLITHGPPRGILDLTTDGTYTGCDDLLKRVKELKPKLHVFGHIHEARGKKKIEETTFVNASICTREYLPDNPPIVVDI